MRAYPYPWSGAQPGDRKSTRLNSSHRTISYAVFCLKKKSIHRSADIKGLESIQTAWLRIANSDPTANRSLIYVHETYSRPSFYVLRYTLLKITPLL